MKQSKKFLGMALGVFLGLHSVSHAVVLDLEDFSGSAAGWGDRDAGEMAVSWTGADMLGEFELQDEPVPETDAFRLTTGDFVGDLWSFYPGYYFTSWTFDFVALSVVASDLIIRFSDGVNTFSQGLTTSTGNKSVSLASSAGWVGGGDTAFSNALANIQYIDIQISRNGTSAQSFTFDNFTLNGELDDGDNGGGGGGSSVPEPNTINLLAFVGMIGMVLRRQLVGKRAPASLAATGVPDAI